MHNALSTEFRYARVIEFVRSNVWAVRPETLAVIVDVLRFRAGGERLSREEIRERLPEARTRGAGYTMVTEQALAQQGSPGGGAIAVIPVHGVIAPRASHFEDTSSAGCGLDLFVSRLRQAVNNPDVTGILIAVDSPGGTVAGVPEAAAEIMAARDRKKVWGIADSLAASAGYWLLAACSEAIVTPSGAVGSIGVYTAHEDLSAKLAAEGVKITLVSAGKYKVEGNPFEPLADEAHEAMKSRVGEFYSMFVDGVAAGRGVKAKDVRDGFGEGRVVLGKEAVKLGMVDRVATMDATLERMMGRKAAAPAPRALAEAPAEQPVAEAAPVVVPAADPAPAPVAAAPAMHPEVRRRRLQLMRH